MWLKDPAGLTWINRLVAMPQRASFAHREEQGDAAPVRCDDRNDTSGMLALGFHAVSVCLVTVACCRASNSE